MTKIDATIGQSIRHYRWMQGVEQSELAAALGISLLQLRSHEAGKSRVSAARLYAIAMHLGVEISVFFQRAAPAIHHSAPQTGARKPQSSAPPPQDSPANGKYLAVLLTHFQRLSDAQKQAVLHLVLSISKEGAPPEMPQPAKPMAYAGAEQKTTRSAAIGRVYVQENGAARED